MSERYHHDEEDITSFFYHCNEQVTHIIWEHDYFNNHVNNTLDIDLLAMLFVVSDFIADAFDRRDIIINDLIPFIFEVLPVGSPAWFNLSYSLTNEKFDERVDFYGKIIRKSVNVRTESLAGDVSKDLLENPIARCVIAFCDILKNPKCLNNYNNAPIALLGISADFEFTSEITYPIIEVVMNYAKKIIDYCKKDSPKYPNLQKTLEYTNMQKAINSRKNNTHTDNPNLISSLSYLIGFGILVVLAIIIGLITNLLQ